MASVMVSTAHATQECDPAARRELLDRLRETICTRRRGEVVPTGIPEIDAALPGGGLACGQVHEWLGIEDGSRRQWSPPIWAMMGLTAGAALADGHRSVWIGQSVWPYAAAIQDIHQHLFVRAGTSAERLWAADLSLRSRAAVRVFVDATGFDVASTRRLQLAAEAGGGMCLLARPSWERGELSAASTRWLVSWGACGLSGPRDICSTRDVRTIAPRWSVELLRCKGMRPMTRTNVWVLERDHATRTLRVVADVFDRPGAETTEAGTPHRAIRASPTWSTFSAGLRTA